MPQCPIAGDTNVNKALLLLTTLLVSSIRRRLFVGRATSVTRGTAVQRTDIAVDAACVVETTAVTSGAATGQISGRRRRLTLETRMTACTHHETNSSPDYSSNSEQTTNKHPFNGPLSATTRVSRHQKGKTNLDFTEARDSEWQWHQLGRMQVCISLPDR